MITAILALGIMGLGLISHAKVPVVAKAGLGLVFWGLKRADDLDWSSSRRQHVNEEGRKWDVVVIDNEELILTIDEIASLEDAIKLEGLGQTHNIDVEWIKRTGRKRAADPLFQFQVGKEK